MQEEYLQPKGERVHIVTLPITPKEGRPFMTFMTPYVADVLHRWCGLPLTVMLNTTGERVKQSLGFEGELSAWYSVRLKQLGIAERDGLCVIHDGGEAYERFVRNTLTRLEPHLRCVQENMLACSCGAVEIPQHVFESLGKKRRAKSLILKDSTGSHCAVCHDRLISSNRRLLALDLPRPSWNFVWPEIHEAEADRIRERISSHPIYVTRNRLSSHSYQLLGESWGLDTDVRWMMYIGHAARGATDVTIVTALTTLNQAVRVIALSALLWPSVRFSLFVHPLMHIIDQHTPMSAMTIDSYNALCGDVRIRRLFLSLGFQWRHHASEVSSKELHLVRITAPCWPSEHAADQNSRSVSEILRAFEAVHRTGILRLMKKLRADKPLSSDDRLMCMSLA